MIYSLVIQNGGEDGIRTHGPLTRIAGFQDQFHKPLGHLSSVAAAKCEYYSSMENRACQARLPSFFIFFHCFVWQFFWPGGGPTKPSKKPQHSTGRRKRQKGRAAEELRIATHQSGEGRCQQKALQEEERAVNPIRSAAGTGHTPYRHEVRASWAAGRRRHSPIAKAEIPTARFPQPARRSHRWR